MEYKLEDVTEYSNKKIEIDKINCNNYVSTENMLPNKLGIVSASSIPKQNKVCYFEKDSILISNIRPYFKKIWFASCDGGCSNDVLNIKVSDTSKVIPKFLYYLLLQDEFFDYIMSGNKGTKMPRGDKKHIMNYTINIPNIETQIKIISILENLDKKIELNNQINDNLFKLEKALYKDFLEKLNNYRQEKLGELCKIKYGKGLPTTKIEKDGYPVYGGNGIIGYYHNFMYDDSQVLISCRGAASGNVIISKPKSFITNNSLILECDRKYHHYLKQYSLDNYYYEYTTGSAQPQITIDNIKDIVINIPKDEELLDFNKNMEVLEQKCFSNLKEIERLEQLRDTLLPKLMNGEIGLDKIEI